MRGLLIALSGIALATGLVVGSSCLIDRKSNDFSCDTATDCAPNHDCVDSFCVPVDGPPAAQCGITCTGVGGVCSGDTCVFDNPTTALCPAGLDCQINCNADGSCGGGISCGSGDCTVTCNGANSCGLGVSCSGGSCNITCNGDGSCGGPIQCGTGACNVTCNNDGTCGSGVSCASSCKCDVTCNGTGSCAVGASCPSPANQCDSGSGCTSAPNPCHSC